MRSENGFTLLELLIVISIIGIIAAVLFTNLMRSIRSAEVRDAANQVVADLRRARSQAQRGSDTFTLILPGASGGKTYTVSGVSKTIPNTMTISCRSNCGSATTVAVNYSAPYGEMNDPGKIFAIRSSYSGVSGFDIKIFGVTGKIVLTQASS